MYFVNLFLKFFLKLQLHNIFFKTRMVLVNAIYFKGQWNSQFEKQHTKPDDFKLRDGTTQKVDLMLLRKKKLMWKYQPSDLKANTCELPYIGKKVSMTIILPNEGVGIEEVEAQLTPEVIYDVLEENTEMSNTNVFLPKFKLEYATEVSE